MERSLMYDVYLYGMISASTVHILDEGFDFPRPNLFAEIKQTLRSDGGKKVNQASIYSGYKNSTQVNAI
jgi:hypothetical protein